MGKEKEAKDSDKKQEDEDVESHVRLKKVRKSPQSYGRSAGTLSLSSYFSVVSDSSSSS